MVLRRGWAQLSVRTQSGVVGALGLAGVALASPIDLGPASAGGAGGPDGGGLVAAHAFGDLSTRRQSDQGPVLADRRPSCESISTSMTRPATSVVAIRHSGTGSAALASAAGGGGWPLGSAVVIGRQFLLGQGLSPWPGRLSL